MEESGQKSFFHRVLTSKTVVLKKSIAQIACQKDWPFYFIKTCFCTCERRKKQPNSLFFPSTPRSITLFLPSFLPSELIRELESDLILASLLSVTEYEGNGGECGREREREGSLGFSVRSPRTLEEDWRERWKSPLFSFPPRKKLSEETGA